MNFSKYDSYKDSGVEWLGEVPEHWEIRKAKWIWHEIDERSETGDEQLLSISQYKGVTPTSEESRSESLIGYRKCQPDDLAMNIMLAWQGGLGVSQYHGVISPAYAVFRLKDNHNSKYLGYLYRTQKCLDEFANRSTGIVPSRWRLYPDKFGHVQTPLPPKREQDRIVAFLDEKTAQIDELIAKKERQIELLEEQKAIRINLAVTRGLNPDVKLKDSGIEWIGEIPEHWEVVKLSFVSRITNGSTPSRAVPRYWNNGTIPWLSSGKVNDHIVETPSELITESGLRESSTSLIPKGSIIMGLIGQGKTRGMTAYLNIDACINQNLCAIIPQEKISGEFTHHLLLSRYRLIRESGRGGNQEAMNCEIVASIRIQLPPRNEQKSICDHIKSMDEIIRTSSSCIQHKSNPSKPSEAHSSRTQ